MFPHRLKCPVISSVPSVFGMVQSDIYGSSISLMYKRFAVVRLVQKCIHLLEFLKTGHIVIALALLVISSALCMFGAACLDAILLASDCFLHILPGRHKLCIL